ncbi:MAG TPA: ketoacyl-ACP synthase III [Salinimicrobium sp.]|nr:ketoacyl-ACP synthase III [Salinimicrobium sp.]
MKVKITGVGSYIPTIVEGNKNFHEHVFLNPDGTAINQPNEVIIEKFKDITGIHERRYLSPEFNTSDMAFFAGKKAIEDAKLNPEELDYIIVAQNLGDVCYNSSQSDTVPSIATRVKNKLQIENPKCVAYDVLFGCPGWIEGVIQANAFIKSGIAKKCLVIGAEALSRVVDPHDRDSMIYADGAGATVLEASEGDAGIINHNSATYAMNEANFLFMGDSYNTENKSPAKYLKMYGRKIYEFALNHVPGAMKECLDETGISIKEVKKILIHQANEKMDEAIIKKFYKLYDEPVPENIMPMSIHFLGNSSVATVPTLLDLIKKDKVENQEINEGDVVILASVGAGMNVNAIVYRF